MNSGTSTALAAVALNGENRRHPRDARADNCFFLPLVQASCLWGREFFWFHSAQRRLARVHAIPHRALETAGLANRDLARKRAPVRGSPAGTGLPGGGAAAKCHGQLRVEACER
jgi:hypothetical protein